jgi:multidrug efflux pump subunit AcrA (membrane-fusion protein)
VEIVFENGDGSRFAGMFGDVTLIVEEKDDALIIPTEALLFEGQEMAAPYCFVVDDDMVVKRPVTIGIVDKEKIEVTSGLEPGELVVDLGKENIEDGDRVLVVDVPQK